MVFAEALHGGRVGGGIAEAKAEAKQGEEVPKP